MSQVHTKKVVLYSTDASEHPYVISNNNEDELLKIKTLYSDTDKAIQFDAGSSQGSEIVLNVQSDEEPMVSKTFATTKTSRKVIRTYVKEIGEPQQFTVQNTPVVTPSLKVQKHGQQVQNDTNKKQIFETELQSHHGETSEQVSSNFKMESQTYLPTKANQQHITPTNEPVNETNSQSTNSTKTSNPRSSMKSCYTYRVKNGVAILETVTKYQSQKQTKKEKSQPQKTNTYTDYQQIDGNTTTQSLLEKTKTLQQEVSLAKGIKDARQANQEQETYTWPNTKKTHLPTKIKILRKRCDQDHYFRLTGTQQIKCNFFTAKTQSRLKSLMLPLLAAFSFRTLISTAPP